MTETPITVTTANATEVARIFKAFIAPFPENEIKLKPQKVSGNRALAIAYIDARLVEERLDDVVGMNNWSDRYVHLPNGVVECQLSVRVCGEWITKCDVGSPSEQPDEGDRVKAAVSDALKRAAVKFGIGRFLYRRPQQWMDYDPVKKQIVRPGGGQQKSAPAPQKANEFAKDAVSDSAREIATAFDSAQSRADGSAPYKRYEAALAENKVSAADKAFIEAALRRFTARFPKTAKA